MTLGKNGFAMKAELVVGGTLPRNGFVQPVEITGFGPTGAGFVIGGSGSIYATIAAAIAGEVDTVVSGLVPQAGTVAGVLVGPNTLSAVNDFYKDWFVVNMDTTPSNGLVCQFARVSSYVGASRTMTLDKPWDFSTESTFALINPARITVVGDFTEDVMVNKDLVIDFGGNRLNGKINVTAATFCWVRGGGGYVTNGIQKSDYGIFKLDDCNVSRRDTELYALLLTEDSNLGRCEIKNCEFDGRVAARRGYMGWSVSYCRNIGVPSNTRTQNLPYTLVESIQGGAAVVISALDVSVVGEFGGAVVYSESSVTGPAAFVSISLNISQASAVCTVNPFPASIFRAQGAGVLTLTAASGTINMVGSGDTPIPISEHAAFNLISTLNFTGTVNINVSATGAQVMTQSQHVTGISVQGSSDTTGSITLSGNTTYRVSEVIDFFLVNVESRMNGGSISYAASTSLIGGVTGFIAIAATQNAGAPTVTISGYIIAQNVQLQGALVQFIGSSAVSVGTWTVSGDLYIQSQGNNLLTVPSGFSGGTITISSSVAYVSFWDAGISPSFALLDFAGTGGTATISGTLHVDAQHYPSVCRIAQATGTGGTATVSGSVSIYDLSCEGELNVVIATGNGATAVVSGAIAFFSCRFESDANLVRTTAAGRTVTGPSSMVFEDCIFLGEVGSQTGGGTITFSNASLTFKHCEIGARFVLVGTAFTTVEAFHTRFNGNVSNKAVLASGTRPTTYRYWKCSYAARYDDLQPEDLQVYDVLPAQAALVQGQPVIVNAANQYQVCVATSIVDGVSLDAPSGAGSRTIAVRQGRVYVAAKAGTVNGDNLVLDLATPTQCAIGGFTPSQNVGTALENVGATVANKCYAAVNVR